MARRSNTYRLRRAPRSVACAVLALALLLGGVTTAFGANVPFFAANASMESVISDMVGHPAAVRVGSVTYVAYQGPGFDPYVASYDESTGKWTGPFRAGTNPLALDGHGAPALYVDPGGYVHIFYGTHKGPLLHAVSEKPGDVRSWRQLWDATPAATYPQAVRMADGSLMLFYRLGGHYDGWGYRTSRDGRTFSDEYRLFSANTRQWYVHFEAGPSGIVHAAFTWAAPLGEPTWLSRYDVFYMYRDLSGVWRNIKGAPVTLPVTLESAEAQSLVFQSGTDVVNEVVVKEEPPPVPKRGAFAPATRAPMIQFITGSGRGADRYRWRFVRWTGRRWAVSDITTTDHNFDTATFDPHPDGSIDSYVVSGGSDWLTGHTDPDDGRGGYIERWVSRDKGATWSFAAMVTPPEPRSLFGDPQIVDGASATSTLVFTEWNNDQSAFYNRMYLWGRRGFVGRSLPTTVERLAGPERLATAIEISRSSFPERTNAVVIATGWDFADAMSAAPLAKALWAPVLLVPRGYLPDQVAAEVRRLGVTKAYIVGGSSVVSEAVATGLMDRTWVTQIERIAGPDRYQTSALVARKLQTILGPLGTAVVVDGHDYTSALAAAPLAGWNGYPILLANDGSVTPDTTRLLSDLGVTSTVVVGRPTEVSDAYMGGLPSPMRLAGADRFGTAAAVARYSLASGLLPYRVVIASGDAFPDGLAGGVLAARARAPMLFGTATGLPQATRDVLSELSTRTVQVYVLGGSNVVAAP